MAVGNATPKMGYDSCIGVAQETTFGTFVTTTASYIEFNTESLKHSREEIKLESINNSRDFTKRIIGNETVEGAIEADLDINADGLVYIMKQAMGGTVGISTISATEFVHTLNTGNMEANKGTTTASDIKSLSFAVRKGDANTFNVAGARVGNLTIKGEVGAPIIMSAEIIGQYMSISSTIGGVISYSDVTPLYFKGVTIKTSDTITSASLTAEYFTAFEFTLNNNLDGDQRSLGSRNITVLPPGKREITCKLTQRFDTTTSYDRFISNTATAIQIVLDSETTVGTTGGNTTYSCIINIPAAYWNSNMPEVGGNEVLTHEIESSGMYSAEEGFSVQIVVRNDTANYF